MGFRAAFVAAVVSVCAAAGPALVNGQSPAPVSTPSPTPRCDVGFDVWQIDPTTVALTFRTGGASRLVTGTAALYAGDVRYDIAFHMVDAQIGRRSLNDAVPLVIKFPHRVTIDGGIVTSIDDPEQPVCRILASPWVEHSEERARTPAEERAFRSRVAALPAQDAPPPVVLPHTCPRRTAHLRVVNYSEPHFKDGSGRRADLYVWLNESDQVSDVRLLRSTGDQQLDAAAVNAARSSRYATTIFNCKKLEDGLVMWFWF